MMKVLKALWQLCLHLCAHLWKRRKQSKQVVKLKEKMRRTIITIDTNDGKYIPVFVVMEELYPDMQDYGEAALNRRANGYDRKKDENLSITIEEVSDPNPFKLSGNFGDLTLLGDYVEEPGYNCSMLLPIDGNEKNSLEKVLPSRSCPKEVMAYIDKERNVSAFINGKPRLQNQLKQLTEDYLGYDLNMFPEHIGNIYVVCYNSIFSKISFSGSDNPPGLLGKIAYRPSAMDKSLNIVVTDYHSGYPVYEVYKSLKGEATWSIDLPAPPHRLYIKVYDGQGRLIYSARDIIFIRQIAFNMQVQKMEVHLKHQGKKARDNYEAMIPKYESGGGGFAGSKVEPHFHEYFAVADTLSRQQTDRDSLKFVFFDGEQSHVDENVKEAKECVRKMLNRGNEICYICDPYFNVDDFVNYVFFVTNLGVDIRIINCKDALSDNAAESLKRRTELAQKIEEYNKLMGREIVKARTMKGQGFHDRFVFSDETGWLMGSSFSEFGYRTTTITQIPDTNKKQILAQIKAWWEDDSKTEPLV